MLEIKFKEFGNKSKIIIITTFSACAIGIMHYFHTTVETGTVFTHFFYIPIILASLWWKEKGLVVPLFLATVLILSHNFLRIDITTINDYFRAMMFMIVALIVIALSNHIDKMEEYLKKTLKDNKKLFSTTLNSIGDGVIATDTEGYVIHINPVAESLTGWKQKETVGKCLKDIFNVVNEHTGKKIEYPINRVIKNGLTVGLENQTILIAKDGTKRHIDNSCAPIKDDKGNIVGTVLVFRDITERKQQEKSLADEKEQLAVTLRSIGDGVITTDTRGNVVLFNKVAEEITGWHEEEAKGKHINTVFKIINETTRKIVENPIEKVMRKGMVIGLGNHTVLISRDGTEKLIADSGAPVRDKKGNIIGVILVFRDVTKTRRMQDFAARAQRLETAGRIAGQIAHDFNNLLGPLIAYPDFIKETLPKDHPALEYIDDMEKSAERISEINQQLLTLGRRGHYNQEPMNLNEIINKAVNQMEPIPNTLIVNLDLKKDLMNIMGGPSQIFRVISNLLTNAREAMQDIGQLTIKTENYYVDKMFGKFGRVPKGEYVKLTIADTGCGIPDNIIPKIFDPFFTTKTTDKVRGSGLGLSVIHGVVKDHNGYIDIDTTIGKETSFYLYFPITRETVEKIEDDRIVGGSEKILIVDDDHVQREVSLKLLGKLGYEALAINSGEKALSIIKDDPHDLIILDMIMPGGIDGAETYRRVLEINPNQRAIIVSGYTESDRVKEAIDLGAGTFIRKPLTLKTIAHAVRKELDR